MGQNIKRVRSIFQSSVFTERRRAHKFFHRTVTADLISRPQLYRHPINSRHRVMINTPFPVEELSYRKEKQHQEALKVCV